MKLVSMGLLFGIVSFSACKSLDRENSSSDKVGSMSPQVESSESLGLVRNDLNLGKVNRALAQIKAKKDKIPQNENHTFEADDVIVDKNGSEHVRFSRRYKGLRTIGGDMVIHSAADGSFAGVDKAFDKNIDLDVNSPLASEKAIARARKSWKGKDLAPPKAELIVYAREGDAKLAYEVVLQGDLGEDLPSEMHVIVDARTEAVLNLWEGVQTIAGSGKGYFVGAVPLETTRASGRYQLNDSTRGNQQTKDMANKSTGNGSLFLDSDNIWGNGLLSNTASVAVDAQYGAAMTWNFFLSQMGRKGITGKGVGAVSRVHYGRKYNNAFWMDSCFCMTYGDGDGTTFLPFASLDIAGHEMTHGLTSVTAKLLYSGESGGLNEATSDIFGTMVEYFANASGDEPDYLMGEKIYKSGGAKALRYMFDPNKDGKSPNCYVSTIGALDVHYSSGVANHFFYLLAEGSNPSKGPVSPTCNGQTIAGIGREKAAKIWYEALTTKFTSSTNYAAARSATIAVTESLYPEDVDAVKAAWDAVSVP